MQLFRSEEHIRRWCQQRDRESGAIFGLDQMWQLADAWYRERLDPSPPRRTPEEAQALLSSIGLTGDAWRL
jgi:hypothetical protein